MIEIITGLLVTASIFFVIIFFGTTLISIVNIPLSIFATGAAIIVLFLGYILVRLRKNNDEEDAFIEIEQSIQKQNITTMLPNLEGKHITGLFKIQDKDNSNVSYAVALEGDYTKLYSLIYGKEVILITAATIKVFSSNIFSAKDLLEYAKESLCIDIKRYSLIDNVMI